MPQYYGYNPPFFGGHQKVLSKQADDRLIKNDVMQLLLTIKGERVMRPTWGTIIKTSIFDQNDQTTLDNLRSDILDQLRKYEPRISADVIITPDQDNAILNILVSGIYTNQLNRTFEIELNLPFKNTEA